MKALGKDIKNFYDNYFPEGCYIDDCEIETHSDVSGGWLLADGEKYDLKLFGSIVPDSSDHTTRRDETISFETAFKRWQKTRDTMTLVLEIPRVHESAAKHLLKQHPWIKVLK